MSTLLEETTFVVTDTETTGTKAETSRIIELAAVKVRGGEVIDRFDQLIDPQRTIPARIQQITGISSAMVFGQPTAAEVVPAYMEFLGDGVFVAHNATFDQRMIDAELQRLGKSPLNNDILCTLRLARRLLKGLRSKGLGHLADFYKIPIEGRHRAMGDAQATQLILDRFLRQLAFEFELETLDELLSFQHSRYASVSSEPRHLQVIREKQLPEVPDRPGVYFMKDRRGAIIYIGKAKRLSRRVGSYFSGIEAKASRTRKLIKAVRTLEWQETPTELDALLEESRLIKRHQPRFNRALRRYRNKPFIRLDTGTPYPTVSWTSYVQDDGATYYGPLGGRKQAELVVDIINRLFMLRECDDDRFQQGKKCLYAELGRCTAPCLCPEDEAASARYEEQVTQVRAFLRGENTRVLEGLDAAMRAAAEDFAFEEAAKYRDWMKSLERLLAKRKCVASPVLEHHAALLLEETSEVHVVLVRYGRPVHSVVVTGETLEERTRELDAAIASHFAEEETERPDRYFKQEVDELRILAHWMYVHRDALTQIHWREAEKPQAFTTRVREALSTRVVESAHTTTL